MSAGHVRPALTVGLPRRAPITYALGRHRPRQQVDGRPPWKPHLRSLLALQIVWKGVLGVRGDSCSGVAGGSGSGKGVLRRARAACPIPDQTKACARTVCSPAALGPLLPSPIRRVPREAPPLFTLPHFPPPHWCASPGVATWVRTRLPRLAVGWLLALAAATVAANVWLLPALESRVLPQAAAAASRATGRAVQLGRLQWVLPAGVVGLGPLARVGPLVVGPGPVERSSFSVAAATVRVSPMQSLLRRKLVLALALHGAQARRSGCFGDACVCACLGGGGRGWGGERGGRRGSTALLPGL